MFGIGGGTGVPFSFKGVGRVVMSYEIFEIDKKKWEGYSQP
jgi:hypothetical protein